MDNEKLKEEMREVAGGIVVSAKEHIEKEGYFDPVIVCIYEDGRRDFLYPRFQSGPQRSEAYYKVNKHLRDTGAIGAVSVMETLFTPKGTTVEKDSLLVSLVGKGVYEYEAWVFSEKNGEVKWGEHLGPDSRGSDMMITVFQEMH